MDINVVIDYLDNKLPENIANLIDRINIQISVITRMELLSWHKATSKQIKVLQEFINWSNVSDFIKIPGLEVIDSWQK